MAAMSQFEARTDLFVRELHWIEKAMQACNCPVEAPVVSLSYLESTIVCEQHGDVESVFGAPADVVLGRSFLDFTEKCWWSANIAAHKSAVNNGSSELLKYYNYNGKVIPAHLTLRAITERGEPGTIAFIRPICPHLEIRLGLRQKLAFPYLAHSTPIHTSQ